MLLRISASWLFTAVVVASASDADPPAEDSASPLARIAFVGASVSAGFFSVYDDDPRRVTMQRAFQAILASPAECDTHASEFFFMRPGTLGVEYMDAALASDPTLLIAIDYLFWFGYGNRFALDETGEVAARLRTLEDGLAQLARFAGPIVIADFPDMSRAVGPMLAASQVPSAASRDALNRRVREWSSDRPQVIVVPLASLIEQINAGRGVTIGPRSWSADEAGGFMSADHLHPSPSGQVAMAGIIADALDAAHGSIHAWDFDLDAQGARRRLHEGAADTPPK